MPGGDGAQHGWEEQHRPDGGVDLHHGTGQTLRCLSGYSAVAAMACVCMSIGEGLC